MTLTLIPTISSNILFDRYHRVLKKEKLKKEKRALDELQKNDPEGYRDKVEGLEKQRVEVSLIILYIIYE